MDAELEIEGVAAVPAERHALVGAPDGFVPGCGTGMALGLCARSAPGAAPPWQAVDLADGARSVALGSFTGTAMETGEGLLPLRKPHYIVERLPYRPPGAEVGADDGYLYRVTAVGFGSRAGTQVVLQSTWRPADE